LSFSLLCHAVYEYPGFSSELLFTAG